jgi:hypothetical protein
MGCVRNSNRSATIVDGQCQFADYDWTGRPSEVLQSQVLPVLLRWAEEAAD